MTQNSGTKTLLLSLTAIGALPALIVAFGLRLRDGQLLVFGQAVAEYDAARLSAALISVLLPVFLLTPVAFAACEGKRTARFWLGALVATFLLFGPAVAAGQLVGGRQPLACFTALWVLAALLVTSVLWLELLQRWLGLKTAVVVYGAVWACSEFVNYLSVYLIPYLELPLLKTVSHLNWILPQVKSGPAAVDDFLQSGLWDWSLLAPTLLQLPLFALAAFLLGAKNPSETGLSRSGAVR